MGLDVKSRIVQFKILILIVGHVTVGLGCYSHFTSSWLTLEAFFPGIGFMKPYELCKIPEAEKCPNIAMERFFVSIVIISLILSVGVLLVTALVDMSIVMRRKVDAMYHCFAGIFLIIAAALYFLSAEQIHDIFENATLIGDWHFRRTEKLVSAALATIQGALCVATSIFLMNTYRGK